MTAPALNWHYIANTGTIEASKVVIVDANKDIGTFRNATLSGTLTWSGSTGNNIVAMPDNLADALDIKEGSNSYLKFVTTNSGEKIVAGKALDMGSHQINNLTDPSSAQDAATKAYVDSAGGTGANPTASVGLTAVNGSASTFLRSDGAPALDQSIAPTWTGLHKFNPGTTSSNVILADMAQPGSTGQRDSHYIMMRATSYDGTGHNSDWRWFVDAQNNSGAGSVLTFQTRLDSNAWVDAMYLSDVGGDVVLQVPGTVAATTLSGTLAGVPTLPGNINLYHWDAIATVGYPVTPELDNYSRPYRANQPGNANSDAWTLGFSSPNQTADLIVRFYPDNQSPHVDLAVDGSSIGTLRAYNANSGNSTVRQFGNLSLGGSHTLTGTVNGHDLSSGSYNFKGAWWTIRPQLVVPQGTKCLHLTSSNSNYVALPDVPMALRFRGRRFTVSVWVKPSSGKVAIAANRTSCGTVGWQLYGDAGSNNILFSFAGTDLDTATSLPNGSWAHLMATYDGSTLKVFKNGTQIASTSGSGQGADGGSSTVIGWETCSSNYYNGAIYDFRIYQEDHSSNASVLSNSSNCMKNLLSNLACWLPLNEGSGSALYDWSGNGLHGSLNGTATWDTDHP